MGIPSTRKENFSLAGIADWTGVVVIGSANTLSCPERSECRVIALVRTQLLPVPVPATQTVRRSHSFRFHTLTRSRWIPVFPKSLQSSSRTPLPLSVPQPLRLRQSERYNVVALFRAEFAVTTRRDDQILFALERIGHGSGLSAGREFKFPELLAGFGIEGA
jgi:hypothetical protein